MAERLRLGSDHPRLSPAASPLSPAESLASAGGAAGGGGLLAIRIRRAVVPDDRLDVPPDASNTPVMDPLVIALAQLVRDRWAAEQRERAAQRTRLRVVEGRRNATAPRGG
jgi:hypothetical protein